MPEVISHKVSEDRFHPDLIPRPHRVTYKKIKNLSSILLQHYRIVGGAHVHVF